VGERAFGEFQFDPATGELLRSGRKVKLQNGPARVLGLLTGRPGQLVRREEIRALLWGSSTFVDFDQNLNYCIRHIRKALGDSAAQSRYLQTIPRRGYRFTAEVDSNAAVHPGPRKRARALSVAAVAFLIGLTTGGWIGQVAEGGVAHDRLVSWMHQALGINQADCPWPWG